MKKKKEKQRKERRVNVYLNRWDEENKINLGRTTRQAFIMGCLLGSFVGVFIGLMIGP